MHGRHRSVRTSIRRALPASAFILMLAVVGCTPPGADRNARLTPTTTKPVPNTLVRAPDPRLDHALPSSADLDRLGLPAPRLPTADSNLVPWRCGRSTPVEPLATLFVAPSRTQWSRGSERFPVIWRYEIAVVPAADAAKVIADVARMRCRSYQGALERIFQDHGLVDLGRVDADDSVAFCSSAFPVDSEHGSSTCTLMLHRGDLLAAVTIKAELSVGRALVRSIAPLAAQRLAAL